MTLEHVFGLGRASAARRVATVWAVAAVFSLFLLDLWEVVPGHTFGVVPVRASVWGSLVLLVLGGSRLGGRSRHPVAVMSLLFDVAVSVAIVVVLYDETPAGSIDSVSGVLLAALDEEIVFRYAFPTVLAGLLTTVGYSLTTARVAGYTAGGITFVFLPGHVAQMETPAHVLPFVAYAVVSAVVVARSGAIVPVALVHAASNMLSLLVIQGEGSAAQPRALLASTLLVILVFAYAARRPGERFEPDPVWPMISQHAAQMARTPTVVADEASVTTPAPTHHPDDRSALIP